MVFGTLGCQGAHCWCQFRILATVMSGSRPGSTNPTRRRKPHLVTPAKAGVHFQLSPRRKPGSIFTDASLTWIPAFAGMTTTTLGPRLRGDDDKDTGSPLSRG